MLLNNQQITEIKICIEMNENENTTTQNLWDTVKAVLRGRFIAVQLYLKKQDKSQINNLDQIRLVARSCPTLCDPMNCSTPGPLSITNSRSSPKLMCIKSVMPSSHLILCCPLLLRPNPSQHQGLSQ